MSVVGIPRKPVALALAIVFPARLHHDHVTVYSRHRPSAVPLSSLFSAPLGASQVPSTSVSVSAPSSKAAPGTQPTPSASPAGTETPTSEAQQHTTAAAAPNARQSNATPVTTLGVSPPASDPRGSISTNADGVQVTLTVTDSADAQGTALNPPANNARRTGQGMLSASLCFIISVYLL